MEQAGSDRPYWWQFIWIGLGMVAYTICRTGFPVGLNAMGKALHFSAFQASVLGTMFLLGQAIIDIPAGYWVERFDRKKVLITGLIGLGFFTVLVTIANSFWSAFVYRVLFGVLEGVYNIGQFAVAGSILPEHRALVNGLTQVFYGMGTYGGQSLVAKVLHNHPGAWQLALYWLGGLAMAYGIVSMALFQKKHLRRYEFKTEMSEGGFFTVLGKAFSNTRTWKAIAIHAANLITNWSWIGVGSYYFIHFKGLDPVAVAGFVGGGSAIGGLLVPLGTLWADRIGRRAVVASYGLWTAAAFFLMFYVVNARSEAVMVALAACAAFGYNSLYSLGYTLTQDAIASASMVGIGIATGIAGGVGYLFGAFSGVLVGWLDTVVGPLWAMNLATVGMQLLVCIFGLWFLKGAPQPKKELFRGGRQATAH